MARTTLVAVSNVTATPLPAAPLTIRRRLIVENQGTNAIYLSCNTDGDLTIGAGHWVGPGNRMEIESGDVIYAIAETAAQTGLATDCTVVTEIE